MANYGVFYKNSVKKFFFSNYATTRTQYIIVNNLGTTHQIMLLIEISPHDTTSLGTLKRNRGGHNWDVYIPDNQNQTVRYRNCRVIHVDPTRAAIFETQFAPTVVPNLRGAVVLGGN